MQSTARGGLSGKARRVHGRRRAERLYLQQSIDEHCDPGQEEESPQRFIPIRGRSEFLPSVAEVVVEREPITSQQLELRLDGCQAEQVGRATPPQGNPSSTSSDDRLESSFRTRDPMPRIVTPWRRLLVQLKEATTQRDDFSMRGFLYGCAMGGGAAAVLLMALRVIL